MPFSCLTTSSGTCRRPLRFAAALLFGEAIGVLAAELKLEPIINRSSGGDRILRDNAAIPFHFHVEIVARQDRLAEVENIGEPPSRQAVLEIIGDISLQHAGFARAESAAAIDKLFRDVSNLSEMEMGGNLLAAWQDKTRACLRIGAEQRFQFM